MAKTKTTAAKRKPAWQLTRRGLYGSIALVLAACAWTFFLGVLVGRGTMPVKFDTEKLGQDLQALREQVQDQQARQLQTYSVAVENKSNMDFYEELKQSGTPPVIDPDMTRTPPRPSIVPEATREAPAPKGPTPSSIPVIKRQAGLQAKKKTGVAPAAPKRPPAAKKASSGPTGSLTLQVASLRDLKTADKMAAGLRQEGFSVRRISVTIPGKGLWYRVQVGRFRDRAHAAQTINVLESKGLKPILVTR